MKGLRWVSLLLSAFLLMAALLPVASAETGTGFVVDSNGRLTEYTGKGGDIDIPFSVNCIAYGAFMSNANVRSVYIPGTVKTIETSAFAWSEALTQVMIDEGVQSLGNEVFEGCDALRSVYLPASVTSIGYNLFNYCNGPVTVYCPGGSYAAAYAQEKKLNLVYVTPPQPTALQIVAQTPVRVQQGKTAMLDVKLTPRNADKSLTWTSSDASIAEATDGAVRGVKAGTATVTATAPNGISASVKVQIYDPNAKAKGLKFVARDRVKKGGKLTLYAGEKLSVKNAVETNPYGAKAKLTWKSSNSKVASVDKNGKITAQKAGSATITVSCGKLNADLKVTVARNKVDNVHARPKLSAIGYGQEIYLKSIEIVGPKKVVCEYYLLFKRLTSMRTTHFSWVEGQISCDGKKIVDGTVKNIKCSTNGQTVKVFKVTFQNGQVKNTNVILKNHRNDISDSDDFWLNWRY